MSAVLWDAENKLGCWLDGSHWSATDLNKAIVLIVGKHYGYSMSLPAPNTDEEWSWEADDVVDYLQSICPHGYWFEIEDNSLFLRSEDE